MKVGRKAAIVPLADQVIIKDDIEKGMPYREIIEDVQRRTGHKYWLEKISQIANSPTLCGVKPVPNQGFSPAVKLPGSIKSNEIAEPSTYARSNPASDSGYLTGASSLTEDGFNNTNVFEWPFVYSPQILQPSIQDIPPSILDNPFGTMMGRARQLFEQKFDDAMWKAADALTDKWLGIKQQSSKSDPKVEELIKRAERLLESSKPPDTTPASVHPDAIAATEKDAKTEFNAPDDSKQPSETAKQLDPQKGVDELLGKQKMNKDDAKEPSDSAQSTKKDAVSNTNQDSPPATENISNTAGTATELPVDSTKGQPNLNNKFLDEETELKKRTEAPEAPPIVPPATHVELNPANEGGDKQRLTQPPASVDPKPTVIQPVNTPLDKERIQVESGRNLRVDATTRGKQDGNKQDPSQPNGIPLGLVAAGTLGVGTLLALNYLDRKNAEAQQPTPVDTTQIESAAKTPPELYGVTPVLRGANRPDSVAFF